MPYQNCDYTDHGFWWEMNKSLLETWESFKQRADKGEVIIPEGYKLVQSKDRYQLVKV